MPKSLVARMAAAKLLGTELPSCLRCAYRYIDDVTLSEHKRVAYDRAHFCSQDKNPSFPSRERIEIGNEIDHPCSKLRHSTKTQVYYMGAKIRCMPRHVQSKIDEHRTKRHEADAARKREGNSTDR